MTEQRTPDRTGAYLLGALLVGAGILLLLGQALDVTLGELGWPMTVILPGLGLLTAGLVSPRLAGLVIAGSIVTMVGLLLFYQNATDHWESWAYAWALVAPTASGVGSVLAGMRSGNRPMAAAGGWQIVVGLALFAAGALFFEGIIGISGRQLPIPEWVLPVAVIALGGLLLVGALLRGEPARDGSPPEEDDRAR